MNLNQKLIIGLIALNLVNTGNVLGNVENTTNPELEIFPFASRTVEYSEDLYDIAEDGIYDNEGNTISKITPNVPDSNGPSIPLEANESNPFAEYQNTIINNWGGKKSFTEKRLNSIKDGLQDEMLNFVGLEKQIDQIEKQFEPIKKEIDSLKSQIDLLNEQVKESKYKIQNSELQIAEKEIDLKDAIRDLELSEAHLSIQEKAVLNYIQLVYQEEEKFLDYENNGSSTLKLLLADNSVSENLMGREYSKVLETTGRKVFYDLHNQKIELEQKKQNIEEEKRSLDDLHKTLSNEKKILEEGRSVKKELLEKTLGEEQKYQELLEISIQQQLESAIAIQNMKDNISFIESKLSILDESIEKIKDINENQWKVQGELDENSNVEVDLLNQQIQEEFSAQSQLDKVPSDVNFIWPVPPIFITAEFHDEDYPKRWGVHNAIDLRAKQFTEIVAPENGYVFQTKDNGMGYSYIILAHKNNLVTVYGHVTDILVKAGTVVKKGEVIGLSGGTPGTKGAGLQTTGPHLHFEVWQKGEPVDPLDFLPIFELPIEQIPDRYLKEVD